jgi:tyrosyl-tRNA synthetase
MKTQIDIIKGVFNKCFKLEFESELDLLEILWALSIIDIVRINQRIFDLNVAEDHVITFITSIKMFGLDSKGELKKIIKNNGLKINNQPPPEKISDIKWIKLNDIEFAVVRKGKNEFDFIFNNFVLK